MLLLDEPTSALDIGHQQSVLDLVGRLRLQDELTVVAAMHDLTLAGQYGRRVVLLHQGRVVADATPAEVLRPALLSEVYGARVEVLMRDAGPAVLPVRRHPVSLLVAAALDAAVEEPPARAAPCCLDRPLSRRGSPASYPPSRAAEPSPSVVSPGPPARWPPWSPQ